jgi:hypothetical protein
MSAYPNVTLTTTSANENSQYLRSNFIDYVTIAIDQQQVSVPDVLNPKYLSVINSLTPSSYYTFQTGQQITTQAFNGTNTTSTWWMIILQNGYIHPLLMQNGDLVFIPNCNQAINGTSTITAPPTPSTVTF